jgi:D-alanyl-D-alanine carboxypeptidase
MVTFHKLGELGRLGNQLFQYAALKGLASKTGYTDLAGGCLVVAFNAGINHPIIIVVLGSSPDGRFSDVLNLASTTLAYISQE